MRGRWKRPKREGISRWFGTSAGILLLLSSFYPGTKLLFWRGLFELWKPVVKIMMRKSSRLSCVRDRFFPPFHPLSWKVCIPALLHSDTYWIFCQVPLKSLHVSGFYLLRFFFAVSSLTFNWNILQHLPFLSCLLASLGLSSYFSSRPSHLLRFLLISFIFSPLSLNSCALPSHSLARSQIIAASLSFSRFFVRTSG